MLSFLISQGRKAWELLDSAIYNVVDFCDEVKSSYGVISLDDALKEVINLLLARSICIYIYIEELLSIIPYGTPEFELYLNREGIDERIRRETLMHTIGRRETKMSFIQLVRSKFVEEGSHLLEQADMMDGSWISGLSER